MSYFERHQNPVERYTVTCLLMTMVLVITFYFKVNLWFPLDGLVCSITFNWWCWLSGYRLSL